MRKFQASLVPMCQEGIQLVRRPLPVYPHVKTVLTREEGMEVAGLLGESKAIILQGHGATTVGGSLRESVTAMAQLEEQAKMNWYAYCAAGPDHPGIPDEHLEEMAGRPPLNELPHFKGVLAEGPPRVAGMWDYYVAKVSQGM